MTTMTFERNLEQVRNIAKRICVVREEQNARHDIRHICFLRHGDPV